MSEAPHTLDGWFALHDFRHINWTAWKSASEAERQEAIRELTALLEQYRSVNDNRQGSFGLYTVIGHKADLLFLHMRPNADELYEIKTALNKTRFADYLESPYSYFSVVELGGYLAKPGVDVEKDEYLQSRLKPAMPAMSQICFYPMNKKREGNDNWFMTSPEERSKLMRAHGGIGQKYAGIVKQIITGSMGLDDWEWGVTLWSNDTLQFKKLIYEMRYDESSARFADFGPFLVGSVLTEEKLLDMLRM